MIKSENKILNQKSGMEYRRFGKTEENISVITLGGMRFKHVWDDPRNEIPAATMQNCIETLNSAFSIGINHIETAYGYTKSETVYGIALNDELKIPRDSYLLMTKNDEPTAIGIRRKIEEQLRTLKTDYLDFFAWHGINNESIRKEIFKTGGAINELLKMKDEGIIRHLGFSTHAPLETIIRSIETGVFDFVNLHYYYFDQRNFAAVNMAQVHDMGVFIISPNDKGGQLFNAPQKVKNAVAPLTPIQWNARFCLQSNAVHTLSFGVNQSNHFDEMKGIFPSAVPMGTTELASKLKLDNFIADDELASYDGFDLMYDPSGINIPAILRLRKLWKCYDMIDYAQYRYNIFEEKGHWFPGLYATDENIAKVDFRKVPENIPLEEMLKETHEVLYKPKDQKK